MGRRHDSTLAGKSVDLTCSGCVLVGPAPSAAVPANRDVSVPAGTSIHGLCVMPRGYLRQAARGGLKRERLLVNDVGFMAGCCGRGEEMIVDLGAGSDTPGTSMRQADTRACPPSTKSDLPKPKLAIGTDPG